MLEMHPVYSLHRQMQNIAAQWYSESEYRLYTETKFLHCLSKHMFCVIIFGVCHVANQLFHSFLPRVPGT